MTKEETDLFSIFDEYEKDRLPLLERYISDHSSEGTRHLEITNNKGNTLLMSAVRSKNEEGISMLIKAGADIRVANAEGVTPLMHAADVGCEEALAMLLAAGAEVNAVDANGNTALMHAVAACNLFRPGVYVSCARALIEGGAALSAVNKAGKDALAIARGHGYSVELVNLLSAGGSVGSSVRDSFA